MAGHYKKNKNSDCSRTRGAVFTIVVDEEEVADDLLGAMGVLLLGTLIVFGIL